MVFVVNPVVSRGVPGTGFWNDASTLNQHFVLPKNGSKYYLKYTFLAFPVLGTLGLGTPLVGSGERDRLLTNLKRHTCPPPCTIGLFKKMYENKRVGVFLAWPKSEHCILQVGQTTWKKIPQTGPAIVCSFKAIEPLRTVHLALLAFPCPCFELTGCLLILKIPFLQPFQMPLAMLSRITSLCLHYKKCIVAWQIGARCSSLSPPCSHL